MTEPHELPTRRSPNGRFQPGTAAGPGRPRKIDHPTPITLDQLQDLASNIDAGNLYFEAMLEAGAFGADEQTQIDTIQQTFGQQVADRIRLRLRTAKIADKLILLRLRQELNRHENKGA